jgi:hypothetical protein
VYRAKTREEWLDCVAIRIEGEEREETCRPLVTRGHVELIRPTYDPD